MKLSSKLLDVADNDDEKTSAQIVASIDDLLIQIFLCLPIKSLIRFTLVSVQWCSIISSHRFCVLRNPSPNPADGLIFECPRFGYQSTPHIYNSNSHILFLNKSIMSSPFRKINSAHDPWRRSVEILHSCNGLLVCGCMRDPFDRKYYIYNPTTKQYSKLPQIQPDRAVSKTICGMFLAFDPSKSPDYKVVCVSELGDWYDPRFQFEVYSSETGSWRNQGKPFTADVDFKDGVYWNGAVHWISFNNTGKSIYFNPDDHDDQILPKLMPTPPILGGLDCMRRRYFGESCDHLHYIDFYVCRMRNVELDEFNNVVGRRTFFSEYEFNVYEMKRDYSEWFVKYKVDLSDVVSKRDRVFSICTVVRCKKDEDSFIVLGMKRKIIRYNLGYKTFENIYEFHGYENHLLYHVETVPMFQYIESLYSV
ncbi:hypothetical protein DH2020_048358 [Rehmannia glutinosa]|uniref:F-box protein n=1 Tax=Rehmannia glutinosa TaxID=99300 RepID=A0ABR0U6J2_REHGL